VSRFDLVIFDCDGVLVDSERLAVRTEAQILASLGWPISESEIVARFVGRSASDMHREIERHLGREVDWDGEFEVRYREVFERELVAVPGVVEALARIDTATCVASSGGHNKLEFTLALTGLIDRFRGRIFSADDVERAKPAPDVFLHAASAMGFAPGRCAVVEDSVAGVAAAVAAGMSVFGFSGSVTSAALLSAAGAVVFDDMSELPDLLAAT
jgi:HAD superfamily hydrolase (TIGR01509 family)